MGTKAKVTTKSKVKEQKPKKKETTVEATVRGTPIKPEGGDSGLLSDKVLKNK